MKPARLAPEGDIVCQAGRQVKFLLGCRQEVKIGQHVGAPEGLVCTESAGIHSKTPGPLSKGANHPPFVAPGKGQVLTLPHLYHKRRLLPTLSINSMQQFIEVNELTSCSCCCEFGRDAGDGAAEGGELGGGGSWQVGRCGLRCQRALHGSDGLCRGCRWLVDPGGCGSGGDGGGGRCGCAVSQQRLGDCLLCSCLGDGVEVRQAAVGGCGCLRSQWEARGWDSKAGMWGERGSEASLQGGRGSQADLRGSEAPRPANGGSGAPGPACGGSGAPRPANGGSGAPRPVCGGSEAPRPANGGSGAPRPVCGGSGAPGPANGGERGSEAGKRGERGSEAGLRGERGSGAGKRGGAGLRGRQTGGAGLRGRFAGGAGLRGRQTGGAGREKGMVAEKCNADVGPRSGRRRSDIGPTSLRRRSDIGPTSARRRSDVAPTSLRHQADVAPTSLRRRAGVASASVVWIGQHSVYIYAYICVRA